MNGSNTIEAHGLALSLADARGPQYQAPAEPATVKLARVEDCLAEPGITPLRRSALEAHHDRLAELAEEERPYFTDDDYPPVTAEELACFGCIATRAEAAMALDC